MVNGPIRERIGLNSAFGVFGPESMAGLWNSKHFPLYSHTMLVVGPEHARTFADGGGSKEDLKRHLHETVRRPYRALLPDADHGEGTNLRFQESETAGFFSVAIPGWLGTRAVEEFD